MCERIILVHTPLARFVSLVTSDIRTIRETSKNALRKSPAPTAPTAHSLIGQVLVRPVHNLAGQLGLGQRVAGHANRQLIGRIHAGRESLQELAVHAIVLLVGHGCSSGRTCAVFCCCLQIICHNHSQSRISARKRRTDDYVDDTTLSSRRWTWTLCCAFVCVFYCIMCVSYAYVVYWCKFVYNDKCVLHSELGR